MSEGNNLEQRPLTTSPNIQKIRLIDQNIRQFKKKLRYSLIITFIRIGFCFLILYFDNIFISKQGQNNRSDSWCFIFYILSSMTDFLVVLNDIQMLRFLRKQKPYLEKVKQQLRTNSQEISGTYIGNYQIYLSIYDIIKVYKFKTRALSSISRTVRYLQIIITFYTFGNLALNSQNKNNSQFFPTFILWIFIISIYISVFELDLICIETSTGKFIQSTNIINKRQNKNDQFAQIKDNYIKKIRIPYEIFYIINILLLLTIFILYHSQSLLSVTIIICIITHMSQLIYEKHIQNQLVNTNLSIIPKKTITSYLILSQITKDTQLLHIFIISANRIAIVMTLMAYFRHLFIDATQSLIMILINFFLYLGQYIKFKRMDYGKIYRLSPKSNSHTDIQCAICLINCSKNEQIIELPCFQNHIYHYNCMQSWLKQRKQCPLCRYSLQIYDFKK